MIASFKAEGRNRASQILESDSPLGPFIPMEGIITPQEWGCLDGTLYVEDNGQPWLIFCREWDLVHDGQIYVVKLSSDLSHRIEEPKLLFSASEAPFVKTIGIDEKTGENNYVTDGPFIVPLPDGRLSMIWSSFGENGYTVGQALSDDGIAGPWHHVDTPLYEKNGGHGMVFQTNDGKLKLALHYPNETPHERPFFFDLIIRDGVLAIVP